MYDIFFTSTNFFLSLVFSIMVFLLTLIIFMAQLSCAGHSLTYPLLIWRLSGLGGCPADREVLWLICYLFSLGLVRKAGDRRHYSGIYVASSLCPVPPPCFLMRMNSDHGQNWNQVWEPLFLWHPQSAIWRPLLPLINALPAVWTNFIAFMYAHALSFSPFRRLNQTQQMWNMQGSLWSLLWARGLLTLRRFKCAESQGGSAHLAGWQGCGLLNLCLPGTALQHQSHKESRQPLL